MITAEQLLGEIEQQVHLAKQAQDEHSRREAVYAARTLCNLLLGDEKPAAQPGSIQSSSIQPSSVQHAAPVTPLSLNEQPLREADANGESLFDF